MTHLKILHATAKTWHSQIDKENKYLKKKKKKEQETGNAQGGGPQWDGETRSLEYWPLGPRLGLWRATGGRQPWLSD